jgi:hypothetical protein
MSQQGLSGRYDYHAVSSLLICAGSTTFQAFNFPHTAASWPPAFCDQRILLGSHRKPGPVTCRAAMTTAVVTGFAMHLPVLFKNLRTRAVIRLERRLLNTALYDYFATS